MTAQEAHKSHEGARDFQREEQRSSLACVRWHVLAITCPAVLTEMSSTKIFFNKCEPEISKRLHEKDEDLAE